MQSAGRRFLLKVPCVNGNECFSKVFEECFLQATANNIQIIVQTEPFLKRNIKAILSDRFQYHDRTSQANKNEF